MIYNDSLQKKMEKHIDNNFNYYKKMGKIDMSIKEYILNNKNFMGDIPRLNLIKIDNYKATVDPDNIIKFHNHNDSRLDQIMDMINNSLLWAKNNKYKVNNTTLHLFISDKAPFLKQDNFNFPLFVITKRRNIPFNLFPDNTINCMTLQKKYAGRCFNWDQIKELIYKYEIKDLNKKEDIIYFKGVDSTDYNHNIRANLKKYAVKHNLEIDKINKKTNFLINKKLNKTKKYKRGDKLKKTKRNNTNNFNKIKLDIKLDAKTNYEPIYNFGRYKYLINLPGRYPWSNRLKYLPLFNSHIIDVLVRTKYYGNPVDDYWETFINIIYDNPYKNFNAIDFYYYDANKYVVSKDVLKQNKEKNKKSFNQFIKNLKNKINDIESKPKKYQNIIDENYNLAKQLNNNRIYQYICYCLNKNSIYFN